MIETDIIYTVKEVAEMLKVDAMTVLTYIKKGKIKAFKFGRQWRIRRKDIAFLFGEEEA